jgi:23S rRNA (adenine2503-C2)-methyltransferase
MKKWLIGKTLEELGQIVKEMSFPSFAAGQIADWLYIKKVNDISSMTNLSSESREKLKQEYQVGGHVPLDITVSRDGTKKYLFPSLCGWPVESVVIPDGERNTLCVSSQAGCKMGCKFCMTARMGFKGNLTAGEIISQFLNVQERDTITNAVYMGMGEPLDNLGEVLKSMEILTSRRGFGWSPKRVTLSTIGVFPAIKEFMERSRCHLAVSMHNPFDSERAELMPMQKAWPISATIDLIRSYDFSGQRRVSFEYIMFDGWNDTKRHADGVIKALKGLECRVNLIRFHSIPGFPMNTSADVKIELFRKRLSDAGVVTTVRASRGEDILAACGMLSSKILH